MGLLISNDSADTEMQNVDWRTLPTSDTVRLLCVGKKLLEMMSSTIENLKIINLRITLSNWTLCDASDLQQ